MPCGLKPDKAFYRLTSDSCCIFIVLLFFSFAKIRWVCKSHTEQSLGKHKNGRVKSKYSPGTGEAKFHWVKGKESTGSGSSGSVTEGCNDCLV